MSCLLNVYQYVNWRSLVNLYNVWIDQGFELIKEEERYATFIETKIEDKLERYLDLKNEILFI